MELFEKRQMLEPLKIRFGEKHFDEGFVSLILSEAKDLSLEAFQNVCNHILGSRPANKPPLRDDFRKAINYEVKIRPFKTEPAKPAGQFEPVNLKEVLKPEFGECENVIEALERKIEMNKTERQLAEVEGNEPPPEAS